MTVSEKSTHRWWLAAVAIVFLCLTVLFLGGIAWNQYRHNVEQDKDLAIAKAAIKLERSKRLERRRAENVAKVTGCIQARQNAPNTRILLDLLETSADSALQSAASALEQNPDPNLDPIRKATVDRMSNALDAIARFRQEFDKSVPSAEACKKLAKKYGVDLKKFRSESGAGDAS